MKNDKSNKYIALILVVLLSMTVVAGCSSKAPEVNPEEGNTPGENAEAEKVLVVAFERDAETLNHIKTGWYSDALIYTYDRLVSRDYDFNYLPGIATGWETSEDGLVWTFKLKEGIKFHDGSALTANDVKWTIETIIDPETASPAQSDFAAIKEVIVKDDYTFDVVLNQPFPNLLFVLSSTASGIISEAAYNEYGEDYGSKYLIGSGPYKFEEWIKGDKIVLIKNEEYTWGPDWMENNGAPIIDKIVMRVIPEESSRQMEIESGGVHILRDVTATLLPKLEESEKVEVFSGEAGKLGYLAYATDKEPFTDVRVRRAINHAINKEDIAKFVFRDNASPAYGYLPPMLSDEYYQNSKEESYEYNVDKAKELLAEAGFPDGINLKLAAENSTEYTRLAEVLQDQLKVVGINVDIQLYDSSSYTAMLKDGKQELFLREYSWLNADILDWFLLSSQFPYPNHSRWQDQKTDDLIKAAATSPTWEERALGYHEVQKHLIDEAVWAPIYIPKASIGVSNKVKNYKHHPWVPQYNDGMDLEI